MGKFLCLTYIPSSAVLQMHTHIYRLQQIVNTKERIQCFEIGEMCAHDPSVVVPSQRELTSNSQRQVLLEVSCEL